jgi:hypothetical protein
VLQKKKKKKKKKKKEKKKEKKKSNIVWPCLTEKQQAVCIINTS